MAYGFPSPTGDLYFSIVPVLTSHAGLNPFPSPTGDLYFSIVHVKSEITDFPSFPSPTGDLYFSIRYRKFTDYWGQISVPYRGLIFLNRIWCVIPESAKGFRPLPGTYISQYCNVLSTPSLVCFRPLPGTYISQWSRVCCQKLHKRTVSVPYRGLIFLNTISAIPCKHWLYYAICVGNDFSEI